MILLMDMGTSNTRLFLFDGQRVLDTEKGAFGAGSTLSEGRAFLEERVKALINTVLSRNSLSEKDISVIRHQTAAISVSTNRTLSLRVRHCASEIRCWISA